ncbi:histidine kinase [Myxozyma melibiosi]|uniref:Protein-serine/threonine kinase n=1 Tax=Myxozyma melibiosi TaxID=54550 RepID=A0ABR1F0S6_9ASCO
MAGARYWTCSACRPQREALRWCISRSATPTANRRGNRCYSKYSIEEPVFEHMDIEHVISKYSKNSSTRLTLQDLLQFGKPPVAVDKLVLNARHIKRELLSSLSRRVIALRNLPYIMMLNPNISQIYHKYLSSIGFVYGNEIFKAKNVTTEEENRQFVDALQKMVDEHTDAIPILAKGVAESRSYISSTHANAFLDEHLRARVGTRLAAKHHIMLSHQSSPDYDTSRRYVGMVDTNLKPAEMVQSVADLLSDVSDLQYGLRPHLLVDKGSDIEIEYVSEHLEYILTELLKNCFRATVEHHLGQSSSAEYRMSSSSASESRGIFGGNISSIPPVLVTITSTPTGIQIRLRDRGGGIQDDNLKRIWGYSESTFEGDSRSDGFKTLNTPPPSVTGTGGSSMGGLGYGLPLSRAYADYFGGDIELESIYGWGVSTLFFILVLGTADYCLD